MLTDPRNGEHGLLHFSDVDAFRDAFEQDVEAGFEQYPSARQDPEAYQDRDERIHPGPAGEADNQGARDHPERSKQVAPHFEVGALQLRLLSLPPLSSRMLIMFTTRPMVAITSMPVDWISGGFLKR